MPRLLRWFVLFFVLVVATCMWVPAGMATAVAPRPTPQFRSYGLAQGLPSRQVHSVVQDQRGFLWIGTAAGLARFDGVRFEQRGSAVGQAPAITALLVDSSDRVWSGSAHGLQRHDAVDGDIRYWRHDANDVRSLADADVTALAQTLDGSIWVATERGALQRMRADGTGFDRIALSLPSGSPVTSLCAASDGRLWVGHQTGLSVVAGDTAQAVAFADEGPHQVNRIDSGPGGIRLATNRGLYRLDERGVAHRDTRLPPLPVDASLADRHGLLWVATASGLHLLDRHGRVHPLQGAWSSRGGLPGRSIRQIMEDDEHGIWFALSDGGLAYIGPAWDDFTRFTHVQGDAFSLPGAAIMALAAHGDSRLWLGGMRGWIRRFDPATGHADGIFDVGTSSIQALHESMDGRLWVGTASGLFVRDQTQRAPVAISKVDRAVTALAEAPDGRMLAAVAGRGVVAVDEHSLAVTPVPFASAARGLVETHQLEFVGGHLWHASTEGLFRWDDGRRQMIRVPGVTPGRVNAFEHHEGGFWLARPDALEHYLFIGSEATLDRSFTAADGWPAPDILNLRMDALGRLWVYGPTGIWRFDSGSGRIRTFGEADGLSSAEFTNGTTILLADGTMYGGTLGGLVGFRPDRQADHSRRPPVEISSVSVVRGGERIELPLTSHTLHLDWNDSDLRVTARALSYVDPEGNTYNFRLERNEDRSSWTVGKAGAREFAKLPAGEYQLFVSGAGRDGVTGDLLRPIRVLVASPPWLRWWAWLIYALCATASVLAVIGMTRRHLRQSLLLQFAEQRRQLAEQANSAKTDFMATLGHEIRTPMTGVLGMAELMGRTPLTDMQRGYVDALSRSGELLLRLVNEALDLTRIESRRLVLESQCVSVTTLVDEVIAMARAQARQKPLVVEAHVEPEVPVRIEGDGARLRQILQNLLGNAVKFTDTGSVTLHLSCSEEGMQFDVLDTGPGIANSLRARLFERFEQGASPQQALGSGLGLAICRELTLLMGGTITVDSRPEGGSRFRLTLPFTPCTCAALTAATTPDLRSMSAARMVLLVEDDATVAEVIRGLLESAGHRVTHVADGLAALAELPCARYELMLLDLDLPGINGFQVARLVRRTEHYADLPILAVSARSIGDEVAAVKAAGMNGFLRKPVRGSDLDSAIAGLSGRKT
ncbi:signal transduction histidine kinase/ligand-binding sensor domain-containing protein/ActR/RegA family two-component response regulator [Luteibacter sp. Sphag1AF]|uniref:hybrid sensor histidine kinase/response regulator n=1 Tax=Luteibacter sp. Sphag1AF TaxID=2587031 RepID=UPI001622F26D|nr:hybrid sensor histidine kinase/response regulator [Luteibacter sp. Sphag1AF]MBB3225798.1 signal transduction histidine kinase/ligand-binding sensor domain-containing protein/ActR/RegA family two-component response regulator [Luteibacter sp. Sphag1AF]